MKRPYEPTLELYLTEELLCKSKRIERAEILRTLAFAGADQTIERVVLSKSHFSGEIYEDFMLTNLERNTETYDELKKLVEKFFGDRLFERYIKGLGPGSGIYNKGEQALSVEVSQFLEVGEVMITVKEFRSLK